MGQMHAGHGLFSDLRCSLGAGSSLHHHNSHTGSGTAAERQIQVRNRHSRKIGGILFWDNIDRTWVWVCWWVEGFETPIATNVVLKGKAPPLSRCHSQAETSVYQRFYSFFSFLGTFFIFSFGVLLVVCPPFFLVDPLYHCRHSTTLLYFLYSLSCPVYLE
ncbi:hypothetical protein BS50DRAFT_31503 [Corynespora cassiicola Philippines]|uniref:Uncharacterized protein n=1 Tax=Corynespora cassiicola Philippines TaxID=1448308 RepID=A0A2T2PBK3_CORCC|nr:hypothetical protein BS50DRAFT_31503 [Corynespora cassiicola Philippines]